jgi:DNA-binding CsgD family transcriptional regulator
MSVAWPLIGRERELREILELLLPGAAPRPGRPRRGVALFGEPGVGKTRLLDEVLARCRHEGVKVHRTRATEAASEIPLGVFAHLLEPEDEVRQQEDLLHLAVGRLRHRLDDHDILAVDDAHLLDGTSVALLHLVASQSQIRPVFTVRAQTSAPAGLVRLWKDELVHRVEVRPLDREATEALILTVLGRDAPASVLERIWDLSRGSPLFVRELVLTAVERSRAGGGGTVVLPSDGRWERLNELVGERLHLLPASTRSALEVVAVGECLPLEVVESLVERDDLELLEGHGLVEVVGDGWPSEVRMAHPLYTEVVARSLSRTRTRDIYRRLSAAVGPLPSFDRLRLATWRLASGRPGERSEMLELAREALARLDHRLAGRLAAAAGAADRCDVGLILTQALAGQGEVARADEVLAGIRPQGPAEVASVAMARASHLFLHLDRSGDAVSLLRQADARLDGHPHEQAECRSLLAQMLMLSLQMDEAGGMAEELLARTDLPETARVRAVTVAVPTRGAQGQLQSSLGLLDDEVHTLARRHRREVPYGDLQLRMARFQTLYWAGRAHDLDQFTDNRLGLDVEHVAPSLNGILTGFRGGALFLRGQARRSLVQLRRASRGLAESDWFGQRPLAEAMRARAAVFAGEREEAEEALAVADATVAADPQRGARMVPFVELSRAWWRAAGGELTDAREACLLLGRALEGQVKPLAVECLHAAVRLGGAEAALPDLERLGASVDGPFAAAVGLHARGVVTADGDALVRAGEQFERLGADLLAAEAGRAAAVAFGRDGRGGSAAATRRWVDHLLDRCGPVTSPGLVPEQPAGRDLTAREREVALLAAAGHSSPEIADTLYISARTVETHLQRVYRKLQVHGRDELARALGLPS